MGFCWGVFGVFGVGGSGLFPPFLPNRQCTSLHCRCTGECRTRRLGKTNMVCKPSAVQPRPPPDRLQLSCLSCCMSAASARPCRKCHTSPVCVDILVSCALLRRSSCRSSSPSPLLPPPPVPSPAVLCLLPQLLQLLLPCHLPCCLLLLRRRGLTENTSIGCGGHTSRSDRKLRAGSCNLAFCVTQFCRSTCKRVLLQLLPSPLHPSPFSLLFLLSHPLVPPRFSHRPPGFPPFNFTKSFSCFCMRAIFCCCFHPDMIGSSSTDQTGL